MSLEATLHNCAASPHMQYFGICKCDCVFIDVGANDGSTLTLWPQTASMLTRMSSGTIRRDKKIPGLRWHLNEFPELRGRLRNCLGNVSSSCYYGFEGNFQFTAKLRKVQGDLRRRGYHAQFFTETLFAKTNGTERFHIDNTHYHLGSSIVVPSDNATVDNSSVITRSVDASRFLEGLQPFSRLVAMKVDIESYEYQLLEHLLGANAVCGKLDLLAIEWHEWLLGNASRGASERLAKRLEGRGCGVPTLAWV